jgi:hypothetical protein
MEQLISGKVESATENSKALFSKVVIDVLLKGGHQ